MTTIVSDTLREIEADENVIEQTRECMLQVWQSAFSQEDPDCAPGYTGQVGYQEGVKFLTKALRPYDWQKTVDCGQVRWYNPSRYSRPVRIVICKAEACEGGYIVAPRGGQTLKLAGQLALDFDEYTDTEDSDNYWLIVELLTDHAPYLNVTLASLAWIGGQRNTKLMVGEKILVYAGPLFPVSEITDMPEPIYTTFEVTEIPTEPEETDASTEWNDSQ